MRVNILKVDSLRLNHTVKYYALINNKNTSPLLKADTLIPNWLTICYRTHRLCTQACFDRPVPPNLIISLQALHFPQSVCWHTSHTPQRRRLGAELDDLPSIWFLKNISKILRTNGVVVAYHNTSTMQKSVIQIYLSMLGCLHFVLLSWPPGRFPTKEHYVNNQFPHMLLFFKCRYCYYK